MQRYSLQSFIQHSWNDLLSRNDISQQENHLGQCHIFTSLQATSAEMFYFVQHWRRLHSQLSWLYPSKYLCCNIRIITVQEVFKNPTLLYKQEQHIKHKAVFTLGMKDQQQHVKGFGSSRVHLQSMRYKMGRTAEHWLCSALPACFYISPDLPLVALKREQRSSKFLLCNARRKKTTDCKLKFPYPTCKTDKHWRLAKHRPLRTREISNGPENKSCKGLVSLETLFPAPRLRSHPWHQSLIGRRPQATYLAYTAVREPVLLSKSVSSASNSHTDAVLQLQVKSVGSAISSPAPCPEEWHQHCDTTVRNRSTSRSDSSSDCCKLILLQITSSLG